MSRYLKRQCSLAREALDRLLVDEPKPEKFPAVERQPSLHEARPRTVFSKIKETGASRIPDLGCGEGKLLRLLTADKQFETILGMDVSRRTLEIARERLRPDELPERQRRRVELVQGSLTYRDERLSGYDAAAVVGVNEHLDASRLATFGRKFFEFARPVHEVLTTPNAEYNAVFDSLPAGDFRHGDHRFERTRAEFERWTNEVGCRLGHTVAFEPVGPQDPEYGASTQVTALPSRR